MNVINATQFVDSQYLPLLLRFWTTNNVQILERSDSEYQIKASGSVEGLDTTRTFGNWDEAARHVAGIALNVRRTAAA